MFKVNNLSLYTLNNKKYLLKDVCFSLNKGESLGIIGKSGDGKSTLAKALLQIYDDNVFVESSNIYLNDEQFSNSFRGKKISLLFQNPNTYLNPLMKVGKQIAEMLMYHFKDSKKSAKLKTIALMEKMNIENAKTIYNYYPFEISGGTKQKICLCIALICNPDILILDESTSYLDKNTKKTILKLIKDLQKEYNFTLIMISHDFKEIYKMCDKVAIMRKGEMIEFGKKDEIIFNPMHPYTIEILCDYLRYYTDVENFTCPLINNEQFIISITMISDTHYVRSCFLNSNCKIHYPSNLKNIKEAIYETLAN